MPPIYHIIHEKGRYSSVDNHDGYSGKDNTEDFGSTKHSTSRWMKAFVKFVRCDFERINIVWGGNKIKLYLNCNYVCLYTND